MHFYMTSVDKKHSVMYFRVHEPTAPDRCAYAASIRVVGLEVQESRSHKRLIDYTLHLSHIFSYI